MKSLETLVVELNTTDMDPKLIDQLLMEKRHLFKDLTKAKIFFIVNQVLYRNAFTNAAFINTILL